FHVTGVQTCALPISGSLAGALDLVAQALELGARRDAGPDRVRKGLSRACALERADAGDAQIEARRVDAVERFGQVVRGRPLDLADETEWQVEVVLVDPAGAVEGFHRVEQRVTDRYRRANADEEAVRHRTILGAACGIGKQAAARCGGCDREGLGGSTEPPFRYARVNRAPRPQFRDLASIRDEWPL